MNRKPKTEITEERLEEILQIIEDVDPLTIPEVNQAQKELKNGKKKKLARGMPNWGVDGNALKRKRKAGQP